MATESRQPVAALITVAVIGFSIGYFVAQNSREAPKREPEAVPRPALTRSGRRSGGPTFATGSADLRRNNEALSDGLGWVEDARSREFFSKIHVTRADLERVTEMEKQRAKGEYILQNERPTTKKFLDHDFGEIVSQAAAARAPEYDQLFAQLGVGPEVAEQLKTHLAKIHRASLEVNVAIQQIQQARYDYEQRVRSTMSEENYLAYRQVEESKPAHREYQKFQNFLTQQNVAVDPKHEQALVALIQTTQAYTSKSWNGPFDGLPQPTVLAAEKVIPAEEQNLAQTSGQVRQLLDLSPQAGLPEQYRNLLESYYAENLQKVREFIEGLRAKITRNSESPKRASPGGRGQ